MTYYKGSLLIGGIKVAIDWCRSPQNKSGSILDIKYLLRNFMYLKTFHF